MALRLECRLEGDGDIEIRRVAGIEAAQNGDLTFLSNPRYTAALRTTRASAVILGEDAPAAPCAMLRTRHPYLVFADAVELLAPVLRPAPGVDPLAAIAPDAILGQDVSIGPFVRIESGASIGDRSILYPYVYVGSRARLGRDCVVHSHVAIREDVTVGHRVVLQNGVVIGSDGFGFARRPDGTHRKIPQVGVVVIEDDVEIGANTTVDRPAVGETRIGEGTKIDNLVQVGHGVRVGRRVLLAAQVGIAGSTVIDDDVVLAGQVGVNGHITVGKGSKATGQSGITEDVPPGSFISGWPAIDNRTWRKASVIFRRLPELKRLLDGLERRVRALEERTTPGGDR